MKRKNFFVFLSSISAGCILGISLMFVSSDRTDTVALLEEKVASLESQLETTGAELLQYQQEFQNQAWELTFLYCDDPDLPIIRAVQESNWRLIKQANILNKANSETKNLEIAAVQEDDPIEDFAYLPTDNTLLESKEPPSDGWISVRVNDNGYYAVPLYDSEDCRINDRIYKYTAIRYTIGTFNYYGIIFLETETPE